MKEATLNQAGKVLEVIGQKGIPREQLQKLLGSGLLSDLLDANVDSVDRDTFRQAIGLKPLGAHTTITRYPMLIDYDRLVEDGIKAGKYDWKNDDIMSKNFPSQETGTREATVELFRYGKDMSTDEVLAELDKQGYRPATLKELLAIGEKHPDLQKEFLIFALAVASTLACAGSTTTTETPPPPPPPPVTTPETVPPVVPPPVAVTAPVATPPEDPRLLPPPWGDLGFSYGNALVLHVDPGTAVLTLPSSATADTEALYTAWEQRLVANGYAAGVAYTNGLDASEPWSKGPLRISIARGIVGTSAYVYAEDLQKVGAGAGAVEKRTVDDAVAALIGLPGTSAGKVTPPRPATPPLATTPHTDTTDPDASQGKGMTRDGTGVHDTKPKSGKGMGKPKKGN